MPPEMTDLLTRLDEAADDAKWGGIHPGISQTCRDAKAEIEFLRREMKIAEIAMKAKEAELAEAWEIIREVQGSDDGR